MAEKSIRLLKENEIDCRVGTCTATGFSILLYKNARVDMQILDEVYGNSNWQREHKEIKGNLYCGVSIWDAEKQQWITKWDCGVESNTEKEKGESSDSFKRACFNVGIGRELYTAPFIWIEGRVRENGRGGYVPTLNMNTVKVSYISYDIVSREIIKLEIRDKSGVLYSYNMADEYQAPRPQKKQDSKPVNVIKTEDVKKEMVQPKSVDAIVEKELTLEEAKALPFRDGTTLNDKNDEQLQKFYETSKNEKYKKAAGMILESRKTVDTDFVEEEYNEEDLPF